MRERERERALSRSPSLSLSLSPRRRERSLSACGEDGRAPTAQLNLPTLTALRREANV